KGREELPGSALVAASMHNCKEVSYTKAPLVKTTYQLIDLVTAALISPQNGAVSRRAGTRLSAAPLCCLLLFFTSRLPPSRPHYINDPLALAIGTLQPSSYSSFCYGDSTTTMGLLAAAKSCINRMAPLT
ncbi:hypothetical protein HAX54_016573, partial [Datura stramonium]|nr:hypothetical protein [Datura stramonium]